MSRLFRIAAFWLALFAAPAAQAGITCTLPFNLQNNTTADATQVMANYNALVTCFTNAAAAGVNSDITSLTALTTPIPFNAGGSAVYAGGTSTGSANAQVVASTTPISFTLTSGKRVTFLAGFTNTGAMTLNVNSQGATNVFRMSPSGPQALTGGEIISGNLVEVVYDGTQFQLVTVQNQFGGFGPLTNLASATTTDLGTIPSHNVNITSTTTITGFGSSASTTFPVYQITFAASLTLTHNATSLIIPGSANITTAANDSARVLYLGSGNWRVLSYTKASGAAVASPVPAALCGAIGLTINNNAGTPNSKIDVAADSAVMVNSSGTPTYVTGVSVTIDATTTGANGLDAGSLANTTFYHVYLINNGTTTAGLASTSATAPTLPGGYTYVCRLGAMKTDGSANFYRSKQVGATTQYTVGAGTNITAMPAIVTNGNLGTNCLTATPTWSAQTIRGASGASPIWIPPTATDVQMVAYNQGGANTVAAAAPNSAYGGLTATNPAPLYIQAGAAGSATAGTWNAWMKMEANTIQVCTASQSMFVQGWRDKVNAN